MKKEIKLVILIVIVFMITFTYTKLRPKENIKHIPIEESISKAGEYLQSQILPSGQFIYRINMNPNIKSQRKYNILRHMGAIYSLNMLKSYNSDLVDVSKIKLSLEYMIDKSFRPVEGDMLGVWSSAEISGNRGMEDQIKLGAIGLSLVALCQNHELIKDKLSIKELEKLGDFIIYMQKDDGGFYSKYKKSTGKDGSWVSLYYPGEAAFGLVELYKLTKNEVYLESAVKAMMFLYNERKNQDVSRVPADHWALIATDKILTHSESLSPEIKSRLISHGEKVVRSILSNRVFKHKIKAVLGGFTKDGRTTPTSTRIEGLTAIYPHIQDEKLKKFTMSSILAAAKFLRNSQVTSGKYSGAWPLSIVHLDGSSKRINAFNKRATEVRIDYVQHALSALIMVSKLTTSP